MMSDNEFENKSFELKLIKNGEHNNFTETCNFQREKEELT